MLPCILDLTFLFPSVFHTFCNLRKTFVCFYVLFLANFTGMGLRRSSSSAAASLPEDLVQVTCVSSASTLVKGR